MNAHRLDPFESSWAMLLRTRQRDGSWVGTPVNVAVDGERVYFGTPATAAKVKRLRNFPNVEIAPCTFRGTPTGPRLGASSRLLDGDEAVTVSRRLRRKYRFVYSVAVPLELWIKRTNGLVHELTGVRVLAETQPATPDIASRRSP